MTFSAWVETGRRLSEAGFSDRHVGKLVALPAASQVPLIRSPPHHQFALSENPDFAGATDSFVVGLAEWSVNLLSATYLEE